MKGLFGGRKNKKKPQPRAQPRPQPQSEAPPPAAGGGDPLRRLDTPTSGFRPRADGSSDSSSESEGEGAGPAAFAPGFAAVSSEADLGDPGGPPAGGGRFKMKFKAAADVAEAGAASAGVAASTAFLPPPPGAAGSPAASPRPSFDAPPQASGGGGFFEDSAFDPRPFGAPPPPAFAGFEDAGPFADRASPSPGSATPRSRSGSVTPRSGEVSRRAVPFRRAKVLFDFADPADPEILDVRAGEMLDVEYEREEGWMMLRRGDQEGLVPTSYVELLVDAAEEAEGGGAEAELPGGPFYTVSHDYAAEPDDEDPIAVRRGDTVQLVHDFNDGWLQVRKLGPAGAAAQEGLVPASYCALQAPPGAPASPPATLPFRGSDPASPPGEPSFEVPDAAAGWSPASPASPASPLELEPLFLGTETALFEMRAGEVTRKGRHGALTADPACLRGADPAALPVALTVPCAAVRNAGFVRRGAEFTVDPAGRADPVLEYCNWDLAALRAPTVVALVRVACSAAEALVEVEWRAAAADDEDGAAAAPVLCARLVVTAEVEGPSMAAVRCAPRGQWTGRAMRWAIPDVRRGAAGVCRLVLARAPGQRVRPRVTATLECHGLGGAGAPNVALPAGATGVVAVAERLTVFEFKERKEGGVAAPPPAEPVEVEDEVEAVVVTPVCLIDVAAAKPKEVENEVEEKAVVVTPVRLIDVAAAKPKEVENEVEEKAVVVTPVRLIDVAAAKPEEVENKVEEEAVVVTPVRLINVAAAKPEEVEDKVEDKVKEEAVVVTPVHLVDVAAE